MRKVKYMEKIKICECCGKKFIAYHNRLKYCSKECKKIMISEQKRHIVKNKYKPTGSQDKIDEIAVKAHEAGMTYGQYVGLVEMRKEWSKHAN